MSTSYSDICGSLSRLPALPGSATRITLPPNGRIAYLTDIPPYTNEAKWLIPIHAASKTAGHPISVSGDASSVEFASSGKVAYVLIDRSSRLPETITAINVVTGTAGPTIRLPIPSDPSSTMAVTPNGQSAYVLEPGGTQEASVVLPVNTRTGKIGVPITVGVGPTEIAADPNGKVVYVVNTHSGTLTPIDTATDSAESPISITGVPLHIVFSASGKTAYVVSSGISSVWFGNTVTPVNVATGAAMEPINVQGAIDSIAITPDAEKLYVLSTPSAISPDSLTPISLATSTPGTPIPVSWNSNFLVISQDGKTAYIGGFDTENSGTCVVIPVNLDTNTAERSINIGGTSLADMEIGPGRP